MSRKPRPIPLLHGPYTPPAVHRGDRINCLVRDREVIVTTWTDAPISWPRGYAPVGRHGRAPGLVVDEEFARALQCESALAIQYWWRIGWTTVAKYRKALGVNKRNNEGTQILIHAATAKALGAAREAGLTPEECKRRSRLAAELRLWEHSPDVTYGTAWTPEDIALLGTMPDPEAARRTGHTVNAVRIRRRQEGIAQFRAGEPVGASFEPRTGRWCARISVRGERVSLGTYDTKEEAHRAYQKAVLRFFG